MKDLTGLALPIGAWREGYSRKEFEPLDVVREVLGRIENFKDNPMWIHLIPEPEVLKSAELIAGLADQPLFGIPFAVKDNIDVAGIQTTAGCPAFSYLPRETATVVKRLTEAGAILTGK